MERPSIKKKAQSLCLFIKSMGFLGAQKIDEVSFFLFSLVGVFMWEAPKALDPHGG